MEWNGWTARHKKMNDSLPYLIGAMGVFLLAFFSFGVKLSHLKWRLQSNPKAQEHENNSACIQNSKEYAYW